MFIPFVYQIDNQEFTLHWLLYKFIGMSYKNNWPIIIQEKYIKNYDELYERDVPINRDVNLHLNNEFLPFEPSKLCEVDMYLISDEIEKNEISKFAGTTNAWRNMILNDVLELENELLIILEKIKKKYGEIQGILTWIRIPSLIKVAEILDIKVIHLELSPLRAPVYRTLIYFDYKGIHGPNQLKDRYEKFKRELQNDKINILTREKLRDLFLSAEFQDRAVKCKKQPRFELGVATSYTDDVNLSVHYSECNNIDLINDAKHYYEESQISLRTHPGDPHQAQFLFWGNRDDSKYAIDFILNCKKILAIHSNIIFEAMLFDKVPYVYAKESLLGNFTLNHLSETDFEVDDLFINYFIFAYLIPFEMIESEEYLTWRNSELTEIDIFNYHQSYYINSSLCKKQLCLGETFNSGIDTVEKIVKDYLNINNDKVQSIEYMGKSFINKEFIKILSSMTKVQLHDIQDRNQKIQELSGQLELNVDLEKSIIKLEKTNNEWQIKYSELEQQLYELGSDNTRMVQLIDSMNTINYQLSIENAAQREELKDLKKLKTQIEVVIEEQKNMLTKLDILTAETSAINKQVSSNLPLYQYIFKKFLKI